MMINGRLVGLVPESRRYVALGVGLQWVALVANVCLVTAVCRLLGHVYDRAPAPRDLAVTAAVALLAVAVRALCASGASWASSRASRSVKRRLRPLIYEKLLRLGPSYREHALTSEVVQVSVEGVDQLETYFGSYLPQLFYALLAPLTLFAVLAPVSLVAAVVLLVCVPLIPVAIAAVQTWAKRLLSKYWGSYTALGDTFLENLQGLTTLKVYGADEMKQQEMNERAEEFRRITMRVLVMQLNSIAIMDVVAYGGAAAGIAVGLLQLRSGAVDLVGCLMITLLAADYFLPMRQLGSFFHIAMNGMAASDKIFRLLDAEEPVAGTKPFPARLDIRAAGLGFAYQGEDGPRPALCDVDLVVPEGSLTAVVGASGCGKSTLAAVLMGRNRGYTGSLSVGGVELSEIDAADLMRHMTYVGHQSYLFRGTVRENLLAAKPGATDDELWEALERTRLAGFLRAGQGLETRLAEQASNLSGGQRQRLALARALLHDARVYIFDEAASNVDVESEDAIMAAITELARARADRTVLLISHRLASVAGADQIVVLADGAVAESGTHDELVACGGAYAALWGAQQELESLGVEGAVA
uniref:ABC transporter ATP-binding protein/permease n=1 Tax=Olsenella timonensis TaxID=1805478 RepID=UPI00094ED522|nr:ABC transporter ATP-binding protein/permease [Olsenella timonensis]